MKKLYTSVENIEAYLLIKVDVAFRAQVERWIAGMSRLIDQKTGREFIADEEASERVFDGNGARRLLIDEAVEIQALEIGDAFGENFVTVTDFVEIKNKETVRGLFLKNTVFVSGLQNVRVKARWGAFALTPDDISLACTILTAGIIQQNTAGLEIKKSEKIGDYAVGYATENGIADYEHALDIIKMNERLYL